MYQKFKTFAIWAFVKAEILLQINYLLSFSVKKNEKKFLRCTLQESMNSTETWYKCKILFVLIFECFSTISVSSAGFTHRQQPRVPNYGNVKKDAKYQQKSAVTTQIIIKICTVPLGAKKLNLVLYLLIAVLKATPIPGTCIWQAYLRKYSNKSLKIK